MPQLNQIIAIEKGVKAETYKMFTAAHHLLEKPDPLSGISRTYTPKDDEGDRLPAESKIVQVRAREVIEQVSTALSELFNLRATSDRGNLSARADIEVELDDGTKETLLKDVPVTTLMFLEKQLDDIHTFVTKLPVLPPTELWDWDANTQTYATAPVETTRTKKIPRNHVKAPATKEHPAQVEVYHEDQIVGTWSQVKFSGALPRQTVDTFTRRVSLLKRAVKFAREAANKQQVERQDIAQPIFRFLFGDDS